jgi:hypothetical protein
MARLSMLPDPSRAVSTDSWTHRRRDVLADETLAKDNHRDAFIRGLVGSLSKSRPTLRAEDRIVARSPVARASAGG